MKGFLTRRACFGRSQDGGVAIEFAIISSVFIFVIVGTLEFGRAMYVRNELSYAADIAAREILKDAEASESTVEGAARTAFRGDAELLTFDLSNETVDGVQFRTLQLNYPFTLLVPQLSGRMFDLSVTRRTPVG